MSVSILPKTFVAVSSRPGLVGNYCGKNKVAVFNSRLLVVVAFGRETRTCFFFGGWGSSALVVQVGVDEESQTPSLRVYTSSVRRCFLDATLHNKD